MREREAVAWEQNKFLFPSMETGLPLSLAQMENQFSEAGEAGGCGLPCSPGGEGCTAGVYK